MTNKKKVKNKVHLYLPTSTQLPTVPVKKALASPSLQNQRLKSRHVITDSNFPLKSISALSLSLSSATTILFYSFAESHNAKFWRFHRSIHPGDLQQIRHRFLLRRILLRRSSQKTNLTVISKYSSKKNRFQIVFPVRFFINQNSDFARISHQCQIHFRFFVFF